MAKILLVEDDKSLREIYGVRLLAEGYDIVSAGDGEEALAMAIKEKPHLIVSDVMMPKISGFDMLDILRSTTETKDIKVIMMTALSSEDQRLRGQQLGADRYLVKSQVGIEDVVRMVHEVLADAPVAPAGNAFASTPSAVAKPAEPTPAAPAAVATATAPAEPVVAPAAPSSPAEPPATPAPEPTPTPAPTIPAPTTPVDEPVAAAPTPTPAAEPEATSLPQPTAPFSTDRPAGLADRIIQPLERPVEEAAPMADLMNKELGNPEPAAAPEVPSAPAEQPAVTAPSSPPVKEHGIAFEETPRTPANGQPS